MKLIKKNDLPFQPGTADIIFRYVGYNLGLFHALLCFHEKKFKCFISLDNSLILYLLSNFFFSTNFIKMNLGNA